MTATPRLTRRRALGVAAAWLGASAVARAQQPTTLRFSWWGGGERHRNTLKAIAAFEAKNSGVKIKAEYLGFAGYLEKLTTQIVSGTEPDIMQINWAWLAMFSKAGQGFTDLNPLKHLIALDEFSDDTLRMCSVKGRLNGLPPSYSARLFLWNQASFERAGLSLPRTWDELFAAGKVFQARLGEQAYPLDGEVYDMLLLAQAYVHQKHGTPYVHASAPRVAMSPAALLDWVRTYQRLVREHVATPLPYRASLGGAHKPTEQQQDWVVGNWAGNFTWDAALRLRLSSLDRNQLLAVGPFLTLPNAKNSGLFGRPSMLFAISKRTRHADVAARFLSFLLTDPEAARVLGLTRGIPMAASAYRTLAGDGMIPALELEAFEQINRMRAAGTVDIPSPLFEDARLRKFMLEVFETLAYGKVSEQQAADRLLNEGNALLARIGRPI